MGRRLGGGCHTARDKGGALGSVKTLLRLKLPSLLADRKWGQGVVGVKSTWGLFVKL